MIYNWLIEFIFYIKNIIILLYNNIIIFSINNNNNGMSSIYLWNKYYNYKDEIWNILLVKKIWNSFFLVIEIILIFFQKLWYEYLDVINLNMYIFNNNKILLEKFMYDYWVYNEQIKNLSSEILLDITKTNLKYFNLANSESEIYNHYLAEIYEKNNTYNKYIKWKKMKDQSIREMTSKYIYWLNIENNVFNEKFFKEMKKTRNFVKLIFMSRNLSANISLFNYGHIYEININNYNYNLHFDKIDYNLKNVNYNSLLFNNKNNRQEKWLNLAYYWKLQQEIFPFIYNHDDVWIWDDKTHDYLKSGKKLYADNKRILKRFHNSTYILDNKRKWSRFRFRKKPVKFNTFIKAFGGYTNWWTWHQDAYYLHGIEGAHNESLWSYKKQWKVLKTGNVFKYMDTPRRYRGLRLRLRTWKWGVWRKVYKLNLDTRGGIKIRKIKPPFHTHYFWKAERKLWIRFVFSKDLIGKIDMFRPGKDTKRWFPKKKRNMLVRLRDVDPDILGKNRKKYRRRHGVKLYQFEIIFKKYKPRMLFAKGVTPENYTDGTYYFGRYKTNFGILKKRKPKILSQYLFISFKHANNLNHMITDATYRKSMRIKYLYKRILKIGLKLLENSTRVFDATKSPLRGFLIKKFLLRSYFHGEKNFFYRQITVPKKVLWQNNYLNIYDKNNNILLNYINKNFFIKYMKRSWKTMIGYDRDWYFKPRDLQTERRDNWKFRWICKDKSIIPGKDRSIILNNFNNKVDPKIIKDYSIIPTKSNKKIIKDYSILRGTAKLSHEMHWSLRNQQMFYYADTIHKIPEYKKILIKKQYIENIFNIYKKEEKIILDFFYYRELINNIKNLNNKIFKYIKKLCYVIYQSAIFLFILYKDVLISLTEIWSENLLSYIIKTLKREFFIRNINNYLRKQYNFNIFDLDIYLGNYIVWIKIIIISIWKNIILKYYKVFIFFFIYSIFTILLILLIKTILPKNIIYNVKIKDKEKINFLKNLEEKISINNKFINKWDKFVYEWDLNKKKNNLKRKRIRKKILEKLLKNVEENYYILYKNFIFEKNIEKIENNLKVKLPWNILKIKQLNSWIWLKKIIKILKYNIDNLRININKLRKNKVSWTKIIKLILKIIIGKPIVSIKNRLVIFISKMIIILLQLLKEYLIEEFDDKKSLILNLRVILLKITKEKWISYIDKKYNSGKKIIWEENKLDEKKNKFIYYFPRFFVNFTRILRILLSFRSIIINEWVNNVYRTVFKHINKTPSTNFKELANLFEQHWVYLVLRKEIDINMNEILDVIYLKIKWNMLKIVKRRLNEKVKMEKNKKKINNLFFNILNISLRNNKLQELQKFIQKENQINYSKERLIGIALIEKLTIEKEYDLFPLDDLSKSVKAMSNFSNLEELEKQEKIYQNLKYSFRNEVEKIKIEDAKDKKDLLQIKYEKILREINFKFNIINHELDHKEDIYYKSIKEYNKNLENILLIFEEKKK